jgi:hypothetical protein
MPLFNQFSDAIRGSNSMMAGIGQRLSSRFASPWLDPASTHLPVELEHVLKFCELLWYSNGIYATALRRTGAYFVTRVKVSGVSHAEQEFWEDFLTNDFKVHSFLTAHNDHFMCYGNTIMSPRVGITRILQCGHCGRIAPVMEWEFKFNASGKFNTGIGGCPKCHRSGELNRVDYRNTDPSAVSVTIWNLHQIRIKYNEVTNSSIYSYNLSPKISAALRRGDHDFMANTPWEYVEAALAKKTLRLFPESVFHIRDTPLSGIATEGWGLPRGMANFRQAYLTQALKRLNMVMALDYSMPLRSLSPNLGGSGDLDPAQGLDLSDIGNKLSAIVADWKRDPAAIHVFPVPVQYSAFGGEAMQMASHEQQRVAMEELLSGLGVPVEFFVGTFKSEKTFGQTLRLMERSWEELTSGCRATVHWLAEVLSKLMGMRKPIFDLEPPTTADDEDRRQLLLNLWKGGDVAGSTALESYGLDPIEERRLVLREQVKMQQMADREKLLMDKTTAGQQAVQAPMDPNASAQMMAPLAQAPQGQPGAGGGAPAQGAGGQPQQQGGATGGAMAMMASGGAMSNVPVRPEEVLDQANSIATELMQKPEQERHQPLAQLRKQNSLLHAAVTKRMEELRSQVSDQAKNQMAQGGQ